MLKPFIFVVAIAAALLMTTTVDALSLKQEVPPIVIVYPDGRYYTVQVGEDVYVSDRPMYDLINEEVELRFIQIEPWRKGDFEVDIDIIPPPKLITGESE